MTIARVHRTVVNQPLNRWQFSWIAGLIATGVTGLGSIDYQTTRVWETPRMTWTEGAGRWAGWSFLLAASTAWREVTRRREQGEEHA